MVHELGRRAKNRLFFESGRFTVPFSRKRSFTSNTFLIAKGHKAVNILWATGKRADHHINNLSTLAKYKDQITIVMLDDHSRIFNLPNQFTKWYPANQNISLIPLGSVFGLTTKGLTYNLQNEDLHLGIRTSSSNKTEEDGLIEIKFDSGNLLLMECND